MSERFGLMAVAAFYVKVMGLLRAS